MVKLVVIICFFTLPEVVVLDFLLSHKIKLFVNLLCVFIISIYFYDNFKFDRLDIMLLSLIVTSTLLLFIFSDLNMVLINLFHMVKGFIFYKIILSVGRTIRVTSIKPWVAYLLFLPVISALFYFFFPNVIFEFFDNSGHDMKLIYFSLSSSVYRMSDFQFARMSFVFDEPGTFGLFLTLLIGLMSHVKINSGIIQIFGFASLSLSYILYIASASIFLFFSYIKNIILNFKNTLLLLFIFFLFLYTFFHGGGFGDYLSGRVMSVFGENNRSFGNYMAFKYFLENPFGLEYKYYESRFFSSSGLIVYTSYFGFFSFLFFMIIFFKLFLFYGFNMMVVIAILISVITRNNFFTGFFLELFFLLPIMLFNYEKKVSV